MTKKDMTARSIPALAFLFSITTATLTFVPRPVPGSQVPKPNNQMHIMPAEQPSKAACACIHAIKLARSTLPSGSLAMLNAANKHARSMAIRGRLFQPPLRAINSKRTFPCGTYLSGASVGRARGPNVGATCSRLWRSRKGARSLHVVIGSHRSRDGVVWCVALFGTRTRFESSGVCARVTCYSHAASRFKT